MARDSVILKLSNNNETRPEGVAMLAEGSVWRSPGGGWLPAQEGIWKKHAAGSYLFDTSGNIQYAALLGCHFDLVSKGQTGEAQYPTLGQAGTWYVIDVTP